MTIIDIIKEKYKYAIIISNTFHYFPNFKKHGVIQSWTYSNTIVWHPKKISKTNTTHDSIDSLSSSVGNKDGYLCEVEVRKRALHTKQKCEENEKKKMRRKLREREKELYDRNVREMHEKCVFRVKQRE